MTDENSVFGEFGSRSPKFDELLKKYQTIDENGVVSSPKPAVTAEKEHLSEPEKQNKEELQEVSGKQEAEEALTEETAAETEETPRVEAKAEETDNNEAQAAECCGFSMAGSESKTEEPEPDFSYDLDMFGTGSSQSRKIIDIDSFDDSWLDDAFDNSLFYNAGAVADQVEPEIQEEPEYTQASEIAEEPEPEGITPDAETIRKFEEPESFDMPGMPVQDDADRNAMAGGYISPSDFTDFDFDPETGMIINNEDYAELNKPEEPAEEKPKEEKKSAKAKKKPVKEKKESGRNEMTSVTGFSKSYKASEGKGSKKEGFFSRNLIPKKDDSTAEKIRKIIMILCVLAFLGSALYLFNDYVIEPYKNVKQIGELESLISDSDKVADKLTLEQQYPGVEFPEGMLEKYAALYARNQDFVGWITIDGFDISLPIVQGDNNEEYLKTNFDGKSNKYGSIFMNCSNSVDRLNYNTTLFGHYMFDSKMFGNLVQYKSAAGYKKAPVIEFNTLFADYKWKVFAVFITNGTQEGDNGYLFNYIFTDLSTQEAVESFMGEIKQRSIYYPAVDIAVSDKILTLSTCTYEFEEARLVIMARMVRPGESEQVDVSKIRYNSNPRYPAAYYEENGLSNPYAAAYKWYPS